MKQVPLLVFLVMAGKAKADYGTAFLDSAGPTAHWTGCREYHGGFSVCKLAGTAPCITRPATEGLYFSFYTSGTWPAPMTFAIDGWPYRFSQQPTFSPYLEQLGLPLYQSHLDK